MKALKAFIIFATAAFFIFGIVPPLLIVFSAAHDRIGPADAIVVLGTRVLPEGSLSDRLKGRMERALELYREGRSHKIIVSGGAQWQGFQEAEAMARYLRQSGVPPEVILPEDKSKNTWQNAVYTKRVADEKGLHSVILVSQYFHLPRAALAFWKAGFRQIYWAHARNPFELEDLYAIRKETTSFYKYLFHKTPA